MGTGTAAPSQLRKPSARGSSGRKESASVCSWEASIRPGVKGTAVGQPASSAAFRTAAPPPRTIRSASDTRLPSDRASLKSRWIPSRTASTRASCSGWLTSQSFCGASRMRAPLAPPRRSEPRKVAADDQAVWTSSETVSPEPRILASRSATSSASTSSWSTAGIGSCQIRSSSGTSGPR